MKWRKKETDEGEEEEERTINCFIFQKVNN